jgi:hypothetical protein
MNKHNIILSILFLVIGFGAGYFYFNNFSNVNAVVENQETKDETQEQEKVNQNKLFAFLDSFKDIGIEPFAEDRVDINVKNINQNLGLIILEYPTGLETTGFSVYDYNNDILYKDIGYSRFEGEGTSYPIAFVNKNSALFFISKEPHLGEFTLVVKDLQNNLIKNLPIQLGEMDKVYTSFGLRRLNIFIQKTGGYSSYDLDLKTLELKEK